MGLKKNGRCESVITKNDDLQLDKSISDHSFTVQNFPTQLDKDDHNRVHMVGMIFMSKDYLATLFPSFLGPAVVCELFFLSTQSKLYLISELYQQWFLDK